MGIGRFAFTPLLPLMVRDGALAQSAGAWLAASNYLGYLAGALTASRLASRLPTLMRVSLAGIAVATAAMGAFDGLAAWALLRFARRRAERLGAGRDQRVGVAASGAARTRRISPVSSTLALDVGIALCRAVLRRCRAARRAGRPALAGTRGAGSPRWSPFPCLVLGRRLETRAPSGVDVSAGDDTPSGAPVS